MRASGIAARVGPWAVYQAFSAAAGSEFARRARPVRFTRGTLVVEVDSATHLSELSSFRGAEIKTRANEILARDEIKKLTFKLRQ